ncbi:hypothetical protein LUZ63_008645 [Rhynchospora breviuscula]|uniref:Translation elongation factor EF1B beta/delta subunit guanine nucleotide exchange domain-containing protein n=1 Tax=Rhynchospora breviuscula TaxID=2022672 RepID=A0A9Q0CTX3_9POAL|nr:hypothetical protein LUZ63_008645 [Rhynchospora breviuscula]
MAVSFTNLGSHSGLQKLSEYLLTRSYISGYQASKDNLAVYAALNSAPSPSPSSDYLNVARWYSHIDALIRFSGVTQEGKGVKIESSTILQLPRQRHQQMRMMMMMLISGRDRQECSDGRSPLGCFEAGVSWILGYGIKKLQIMMTIVDDLVSVDTLIEEHLTTEPANEYIQSCDIVAFNKI